MAGDDTRAQRLSARERVHAPSSTRLLVVASAFLLTTIAVGVWTRATYADATEWVKHTSEVMLALADTRGHSNEAELALTRGETADGMREALTRDARMVRWLTRDNAQQQVRAGELERALERAGERTEGDAPTRRYEPSRRVIGAMMSEERSLFASRARREQRAKRMSDGALVLSGSLAVLFVGVAIWRLRAQQASMARQSAMLDSILHSIGDGVVALDARREIVVANAAARRLLGLDADAKQIPEGAETRYAVRGLDGEPLESSAGPIARAARGEVVDALEFEMSSPDAPGGRVWISATSRPVRDTDGRIIAAVSVMHDVTEARRQAAKLESLSVLDDLTGLHNRRGFFLLAEQHARVARRAATPFAILFADLDGLKTVNDTRGHDAGDALIREAAGILRACCRESDVAARLGGDEFVVLIAGAGPAAASAVQARLEQALAAAAAQVRSDTAPTMSIGVACSDPELASSVEDLVAQADQRMYASKVRRRAQRPAERRKSTAPEQG